MYEFPYGAGQQLNLNWIINEIITLHKQLDPDWDLPQFDTAFPYTNLNTLNLDWILRELKAIKDLAPTEDAQLLKMVANALIAATYDAATQYNVNDIVYRDNEKRLYKCTTATAAGGEPWTPAHWEEINVGGVLTYLLINGGGTVPVTNVRYNSHELQQEKNGAYSAIIAIDDTPTNSSNKLASSKAVYNVNQQLSNFFDITSGNLQTLTAATDYNTLTTVGHYLCTTQNAETMINAPTNAYGHKLVVMHDQSTDVITQIAFINYDTSGVLIRTRRSTASWGTWHYLTPIKITDTVSAGSTGQTFTHPSITANCTAYAATFSNPAAVGSDVTFSTGNKQITIAGTFYDTVDITYFVY